MVQTTHELDYARLSVFAALVAVLLLLTQTEPSSW